MKITAITQQQRRTDRYSVFVDGKYAFSLSESGLLEAGLARGQELSPAELRALKKTAGLDKAYGNALRYVAMRQRSEWELQDYLVRRKQLDGAAASDITKRLRSIGLVDDRAFAQSWVAGRRALKPVSLRRLKLELQQKHVPPEIIQGVLAEDPADERQVLAELVAKKRARYPDQQKLMQYLARQGFGYDDIKRVLNEEDN